MVDDMLEQQIKEIKNEIEKLPKGNISIKIIKGNEQPYLQWSENGKRHSEYIKADKRIDVMESVKRRKALEEELKGLEQRVSLLKAYPTEPNGEGDADPRFETRVITGDGLISMCERVKGLKARDCMKVLNQYINREADGRVCLIYGLRRTGKTTLLLQAISELPKGKTAYIKVAQSDSFSALEKDMRCLEKHGYRYIFLDEVTLLSDFIDSASLFSDIYAMMGMKIILSGTDSLGFLLSTSDELYDRAYTIHTTFIPFREYSRVLGVRDIDEYIRYGGTLRVGETDFDDPELRDESVSFRDDESTRRYIDTAIAHNIQHSLEHYRHGTHFRHLVDLYDAGELTSAVNRVIEDMNHQFLLSVLTKDFISNDLGISRKNLRKSANPDERSDVLDRIDEDTVVESFRAILDIINKDEMKVELTKDHIREIREYLFLLDLIVDAPIETIRGETPIDHVVFVQPGMRYVQAQALVHSLMKDKIFLELDAKKRAMVTERILNEVRGRMMEEIVLVETMKAVGKTRNAFKLQFPVGEFDMVCVDEKALECKIYEIKHSDKIVTNQCRFLMDEEMCASTEKRYGKIVEKSVIYRGETKVVEGIVYKNVEEYLMGLGA